MPPRRRKPPRTPLINKLKDQGLTRWEILDRLDGQKDRKQLSRTQYEAIGFNDWRVDRFLNKTAPRFDNTPRTGGEWVQDERDSWEDTDGDGIDEPIVDPKRPENDSAFGLVAAILRDAGLGSLTPYLENLIRDGITDPASLQLRIQETPEWKKRFRGNELLKQQGLGVISPAEYLNLERSYASVMRQFGLPPGFYDKTEDFVNFIGNNVSPQELAERAGMAVDLANQVDPTQRETLRSMYGIGEGDIAAYFLDAKKAQPILQKQVQAVKIAGAGKRAGLAVGNDRARFEDMADRGVNEQMAQQGYGQIANEIDPLKNLASIWGRGDDWTLEEAEDATFFQDADAKRERKGLINQERAAFSGASGFRAGVSGRRSSAGQF